MELARPATAAVAAAAAVVGSVAGSVLPNLGTPNPAAAQTTLVSCNVLYGTTKIQFPNAANNYLYSLLQGTCTGGQGGFGGSLWVDKNTPHLIPHVTDVPVAPSSPFARSSSWACGSIAACPGGYMEILNITIAIPSGGLLSTAPPCYPQAPGIADCVDIQTFSI